MSITPTIIGQEVFIKIQGHTSAHKAKAERVEIAGVWFSGKILESIEGLPVEAWKVDKNKPIKDMPKRCVFIPFHRIDWLFAAPLEETP